MKNFSTFFIALCAMHLAACGGGDDPAPAQNSAGASNQAGASGSGAGGSSSGAGGSAAGSAGAGGDDNLTRAEFKSYIRIAVITDLDIGTDFDLCISEHGDFDYNGKSYDGPLGAKYGPEGGKFLFAPTVTNYYRTTATKQYLRLVKKTEGFVEGKGCSIDDRIKKVSDSELVLEEDGYYTAIIYGQVSGSDKLQTLLVRDQLDVASSDTTAIQFFNGATNANLKVGYTDTDIIELFSETGYGQVASTTGTASGVFSGNYLKVGSFLASDLQFVNTADSNDNRVVGSAKSFETGSVYSLFAYRGLGSGYISAFVCKDKQVLVGEDDGNGSPQPTRSANCTFE